MDKHFFWTDCDNDITIRAFDKSMLEITMQNAFDLSFDTAYLTKSDVKNLIAYLNKAVGDMCYMDDINHDENKRTRYHKRS